MIKHYVEIPLLQSAGKIDHYHKILNSRLKKV